MPEKEGIYTDVEIKWVGIIDLNLFYKKLQEWIKGPKKYALIEDRYVEKTKPNGKQIEWIWKCEKKEGHYLKFYIDIDFLLIGVTDAEVEKDGKKLKLSKIDTTVKINAHMEKDIEDKWKQQAWFLKKVYENYVYKQQIEEGKIECYKNTADLIEEIKNYFSMYSFK